MTEILTFIGILALSHYHLPPPYPLPSYWRWGSCGTARATGNFYGHGVVGAGCGVGALVPLLHSNRPLRSPPLHFNIIPNILLPFPSILTKSKPASPISSHHFQLSSTTVLLLSFSVQINATGQRRNADQGQLQWRSADRIMGAKDGCGAAGDADGCSGPS